jgi:hypothetical protein
MDEAEKHRVVVKSVRFTPAEIETVKAAAAAAGMTPGAYIRQTALGATVRQRRGVKADAAIRELSRVGNNLNQLARSYHVSGRVPEPERLDATLTELLEIIRAL